MNINKLINIGQTGELNNQEFSRKFLFSLHRNPFVKTLPLEDLVNLMRGLAIIETQVEYGFGSTTVMGKLLNILISRTRHDETLLNHFVDWALANRTNPYIPFGTNVPIEIKSIKELAAHDKKHWEHIEKMEKEKIERSRIAKEKKIKIIQEHKNNANLKNQERDKIIENLSRLDVMNRFAYIIRSEKPIDFFPEKYAKVSSKDLAKIPKITIELLSQKLKYSKRNSDWKKLQKIIKQRPVE
ncbi:hypothetical protein HGA34_04270 [Candidatus Falkowbacteria bacterium]|nr:hypothetical protein [Candidatus Falkowbacteria bacterium]